MVVTSATAQSAWQPCPDLFHFAHSASRDHPENLRHDPSPPGTPRSGSTLRDARARRQPTDMTTSGGKKITGKLVAVDAQGVTFSGGEAQARIAGKDIVVVDFHHAVSPVPKAKETGRDPTSSRSN